MVIGLLAGPFIPNAHCVFYHCFMYSVLFLAMHQLQMYVLQENPVGTRPVPLIRVYPKSVSQEWGICLCHGQDAAHVQSSRCISVITMTRFSLFVGASVVQA